MTKKPAETSTTAADPVAAARAEVERLAASEFGIALLLGERAKESAGLRADRGDQVLDAADPAAAARASGQRVAAMLEEGEALADASRRASDRRRAAILALFAAEADEREKQADELEAEATKLQAESERLRAAVAEHDDWQYFPAAGRDGDGRYFAAALHNNGEFRVVDARGPIFTRKFAAAISLRREAEQLRLTKTPQQAGMIEGDSADELIEKLYSDPMRIGPPIGEIQAWAESAIAKERGRRSRIDSTGAEFVPVDAPMKLHLEFRNGAIDAASSGIVREEEIAQADPYLHLDRAVQVEPEELGDPEFATRVVRRSSAERSPFATGPTKAEVEREAAATGEPLEDVARRLGATFDSAAEIRDVDVDSVELEVG